MEGAWLKKHRVKSCFTTARITQLNLSNEFQYLTSFISHYHFQDVSSLCHKQCLFSQHRSGCVSLPDTGGELDIVTVLGKHCPYDARAFGNSQCSQQQDGNMVQ